MLILLVINCLYKALPMNISRCVSFETSYELLNSEYVKPPRENNTILEPLTRKSNLDSCFSSLDFLARLRPDHDALVVRNE